MDINVTVDEIIEIWPYINNSTIDHLNDLEEATDESEKVWNEYCDILDSGELSNCEHIKHVMNNFLDDTSSRVLKNKNYLEKIEQKIEELKTLRNNMSDRIIENTKYLKKIEGKVSNITKKKENLLHLRDKILIYKLLTNTCFTYKGSSVQGYVVSPVTKNLHPFEFNTKKYSNSDITNHLYEVLKKAASETVKTEESQEN